MTIKNKKPFKIYLLLIVIASLVSIIDQMTKSFVVKSLRLYESMVVIHHFFSLTYTRNPGAAFGFLAEQDGLFRSVFFLFISVVAFIFLVYFFIKTPNEDILTLVALSLILGGAIGNFLDRIKRGEVIDFLDFYIGPHHWWIFNVADSAITVGISLMILQTFFKKTKENELNFNL